MKESRKQFILQLHKKICSKEIKQEIENEFPKLFKKETLEVGKWYKIKEAPQFIFCFNGDYSKKQYGFNLLEQWSDELAIYELDKHILCAEQEVKEALIKEAEKRGYKDGVIVNSFVHDRILEIIDSKNNIEFIGYRNKLHYGTEQGLYVVIFDNGKWAEIIENIISRAEAEKQLNAKIID